MVGPVPALYPRALLRDPTDALQGRKQTAFSATHSNYQIRLFAVPGLSSDSLIGIVLDSAQTVIDDAHMILQASCLDSEFTLTLNDKAKALAAISVLAEVSDADLMKMYLEYFTQALSQLQLSINLLRDAADVPATSKSSILNETVRLLQAAVLDAHILFFREVTQVVPGEAFSANGLISKSKGVILQHVISAFTSRTDVGMRDLFAMDSYFQRSTLQLARLKEMFNVWLRDTLPIIHLICDEALNLTESAAEVALLQQVVWRRSCFVDDENDRGKEKQRFWEEASREFLIQIKRLRVSGASLDANTMGGALLWNSVFKAPFTKQV